MTRWSGSLLGGSIEEDSHIYLGTGRTRGLLMIVARTGGTRVQVCWQRTQQFSQGASKAQREERAGTAACGRQEDMTEPERGGDWAAFSRTQPSRVVRPVARELTPIADSFS